MYLALFSSPKVANLARKRIHPQWLYERVVEHVESGIAACMSGSLFTERCNWPIILRYRDAILARIDSIRTYRP